MYLKIEDYFNLPFIPDKEAGRDILQLVYVFFPKHIIFLFLSANADVRCSKNSFGGNLMHALLRHAPNKMNNWL